MNVAHIGYHTNMIFRTIADSPRYMHTASDAAKSEQILYEF